MQYAVLASLALLGVGAVTVVAFLYESIIENPSRKVLVDGMSQYVEGDRDNTGTYAWDVLQQLVSALSLFKTCCSLDVKVL